jgi:hypothetical protein
MAKLILDEMQAAKAVGIASGLCLLAWDIVLYVGGIGFLDWVMEISYMSNPFTIPSVDIVTLVIGIVAAVVVGAIGGFVFAKIWNMS